MRVDILGFVADATYKVTSSDTETSIASAKYDSHTIGAFITVEDNPIRIAFGGTNPTTSLGHKVEANDSITLRGLDEVKGFQYINAVSGSNATLQITILS